MPVKRIVVLKMRLVDTVGNGYQSPTRGGVIFQEVPRPLRDRTALRGPRAAELRIPRLPLLTRKLLGGVGKPMSTSIESQKSTPIWVGAPRRSRPTMSHYARVRPSPESRQRNKTIHRSDANCLSQARRGPLQPPLWHRFRACSADRELLLGKRRREAGRSCGILSKSSDLRHRSAFENKRRPSRHGQSESADRQCEARSWLTNCKRRSHGWAR